MHWKKDSAAITQADLEGIYKKLFGTRGTQSKDKTSVVDIIKLEAEACLKAGVGINFEHKIVLSIAIRLAAERFMADKIADEAFLEGIQEKQTSRLLKRFKEDFGGEVDAIRTLQSVVLMTPENIHLNAFMYNLFLICPMSTCGGSMPMCLR